MNPISEVQATGARAPHHRSERPLRSPSSYARRSWVGTLAGAALLALLLGACGSSSKSGSSSTAETTSTGASSTSTSTQSAASSLALSARSFPGIGKALVDASGRTLYIFEPDAHSKVTCTGGCAQLWPPLKLASGQKASAAAGVQGALLGSDPDPEGGIVVTYGGWPLYTYQADTAAGQDNGQGVETNGGLWYVISPEGKVITKKP